MACIHRTSIFTLSIQWFNCDANTQTFLSNCITILFYRTCMLNSARVWSCRRLFNRRCCPLPHRRLPQHAMTNKQKRIYTVYISLYSDPINRPLGHFIFAIYLACWPDFNIFLPLWPEMIITHIWNKLTSVTSHKLHFRTIWQNLCSRPKLLLSYIFYTEVYTEYLNYSQSQNMSCIRLLRASCLKQAPFARTQAGSLLYHWLIPEPCR